MLAAPTLFETGNVYAVNTDFLSLPISEGPLDLNNINALAQSTFWSPGDVDPSCPGGGGDGTAAPTTTTTTFPYEETSHDVYEWSLPPDNTSTSTTNTGTTLTAQSQELDKKPTPPAAPPRNRRKRTGLSKREKSLERNRVAASKCRQKKKEHTQLLEWRFKQQSEKKRELDNEVSDLRGQILELKHEILKHAHCGDGRVGHHLAQMMKHITHCDSSPEPEESEARPQESVSLLESGTAEAAAAEAATAAVSPEGKDAVLPEMRWQSETSFTSDSSYAYSMEENFDGLIHAP